MVIDVGATGSTGSSICVVCFDAPRDAVLMPCGHADLCMACAKQVARTNALCPICRAPIAQALQFGETITRPDGSVVMTSKGGFNVG